MKLEECLITEAIVKEGLNKLASISCVDVVVVGAGPSGITAAAILAKSGVNVVVLERELHVGGGMWGGGMMFPAILVEKEQSWFFEEAGVKLKDVGGGLLAADPVEAVTKCVAHAIDLGAKVFVGLMVEDIIHKEGRVAGVVVNWTAVHRAGFHVDPLNIESKVVIDATGHEAYVARIAAQKLKAFEVKGEGPMNAQRGEEQVVDATKEVYPGLIVAGMTASAVAGAPRMGPVFGGMIASGKKAAEIALKILGKQP